MPTVKHFEDLEAWQMARELTSSVYRTSAAGKFGRDFCLRDQMRRAAISVMSNIAEGFERGGDREFLQFLSVSKGSCGELRSQLYVAMDQGYMAEGEFCSLSEQARRISAAVSSLMGYLRRSGLRGAKFKSASLNS